MLKEATHNKKKTLLMRKSTVSNLMDKIRANGCIVSPEQVNRGIKKRVSKGQQDDFFRHSMTSNFS